MRGCLFVIALLAWACAWSACSAGAAQQPPPLVSETPPTTKDPGAVQDERPLPSSTKPETGSGSAAPEPRPDGGACFTGTDCESGTCEGEGCTPGAPGKCMPRSRMCTRDLRSYCGCDGKTFRSSGSCPGKRFSARQACP